MFKKATQQGRSLGKTAGVANLTLPSPSLPRQALYPRGPVGYIDDFSEARMTPGKGLVIDAWGGRVKW